jgi:7-cyano-7-deazaguanine synthase
MTERAVLLASGGLDSTTLCYDLVRQRVQVTPLFLNYAQHCAATELATLRDVLPAACREHVVILDVASVYAGASSRLIREPDLWSDNVQYAELYLPYRSLLFLSVACAYAAAHDFSTVYAAFINSNHAQEIDCSHEFFVRLNGLLAEYGGVDLRLPYRDWTKRQVVEHAATLGVPIGRTFSCQVSSDVPCGACPNCVDRLDALGA